MNFDFYKEFERMIKLKNFIIYDENIINSMISLNKFQKLPLLISFSRE